MGDGSHPQALATPTVGGEQPGDEPLLERLERLAMVRSQARPLARPRVEGANHDVGVFPRLLAERRGQRAIEAEDQDPLLRVVTGDQLRSGGAGDDFFMQFNAKNYHQPSDEYKEDWDFSGMEEMARFGMVIALDVANQDKLPTWKAGDEFLPARQASGVK